jgi:hypothetical protein
MSQPICDEQEPELLPVTGAEASGQETPHSAACHFSDQLVGMSPSDLFTAVSSDAVLPDDQTSPSEAQT